MGIIITSAYVLLFLIIIRTHLFFKIEGIRNEALRFAFLLKIMAGFALYFIYSYYYVNRSTADIFKYFDDGKIMANALWTHPLDYFKMLFGIQNDTDYFSNTYYNQMNHWYRGYDSNIFSDSHLIIRYNAFLTLFSFGYYHVHTVFSCFLSFIGLTALLKFFIEFVPKAKFGLFLSLYALPSVIFWGSGVLKEALIFFSMGLLLYTSTHFFERFSIWKVLIITGCIVILLYTKIYIFIILFPLMILFKSMKYNQKGSVGGVFAGILMLTAIIGYLTLSMISHVDILAMLAQKQHDFYLLAQSQHTGSLIQSYRLTSDWLSFVYQIPFAFLNSFFRPFVGIDNSFIMLPSVIENVVLWSFSLLAIIFRAKLNRTQKLTIHFSIWFVLGVFLLTGLTTPILGAIVRYRVIALPFWGIIIAIAIDKRKLHNLSKPISNALKFLERKIVYKSIIRN